jgi:hypothetical protein
MTIVKVFINNQMIIAVTNPQKYVYIRLIG